MSERKGARRRAEIPAATMRALNRGEIESRNLVEWLAIDMVALSEAVVPDLAAAARRVRDEGVMARTRALGEALRDLGEAGRLKGHRSDTVRGWACLALAGAPGLGLPERLERARPFARDPHANVREVAWLAVRPFFEEKEQLAEALRLLHAWVESGNEYERRFAVEGTRPRGVWCRHLGPLKEDPSPAAGLLEEVRSDPSRYVRNAVGNWLNDASKSRADWVEETCTRWLRESPTAETGHIVSRALRTLRRS